MVGFPPRQSGDPPCLSIDWLEVCEAGYLKGLIASIFCAPRQEVIDCPEPDLVAGQVVALLVVYAARRRRRATRHLWGSKLVNRPASR